jgi:S-adenosyl methyltransferase
MRGTIDTTKPSPARMYDYYLCGKNNFAVDRAAADIALSAVPDGRKAARDNRDFLVRAVTYLADKGIDQFIDLGTGIPTGPNVHEVAQGINPASVVAYVDNDPMAIAHGRVLIADSGDNIIAVDGDIRQPLGILTDGPARDLIDFSRPVGVLFVAVLHFITEAENPYDAVATFRDHVAPGSYIAISHITSEGMKPDAMNTIR